MAMDIDKLFKILLFTPGIDGGWGLCGIFWGPPGIGKSSIVKAIARKYGLDCEVLSPGMRGEAAFGVVPVPSADGRVLRYPMPEWAERFVPDASGKYRRGLVFVDEGNTAPPPIQSPMLGLMLDRMIGTHHLGPNVRLLSAANPTASAAGGWDLAPALANRLAHLDWQKPTAKQWGEYMLSNAQAGEAVVATQDAEKIEQQVKAKWPAAYARAAMLSAAFVEAHPSMLHAEPAAHDPQAAKAWPSHRSWEMATRSLAGCYVHDGDADHQTALVAGFVGSGASVAFFEYIKKIDLPNPADILDGKATFRHEKKRLDRTIVVLKSCALTVAPQAAEKRKERNAACWNLLTEFLEHGKDVVYPAAAILTQAGLHGVDEADKVMSEIGSLLTKAGIHLKPKAA